MSDLSRHLSPRARAVIDAARGADEPTLADKNRVRAAVFAHVGVAAAASKAAASDATVSKATVSKATASEGSLGATKLLGLKIVVGVAIVGGMGLGGYFLARGGDQAPGTTTPAETRAVLAEPAVPEPVAGPAGPTGNAGPGVAIAPAGALDDEQGDQEDQEEMAFEPVAVAPARRGDRTQTDKPRSRARQTQAPQDESDGVDPVQALKEEQALIASAKSALDAGDTGRAMRSLSEHAGRFPRGILAEERTALRVMTLCASGDVDQAEKERAGFLARWPRSPHAGRVRGACSE
jgi:hypothetical protein